MTLNYTHRRSSLLVLLDRPYISLPVSGLLLFCLYLTPFLDITTFEVNVTAYDLENWFIFDNNA